MEFINAASTASQGYLQYNDLKIDLNTQYVSTPIEYERIQCRNKLRLNNFTYILKYMIIPIIILICMIYLEKTFEWNFGSLYFIPILTIIFSIIYLSSIKSFEDAKSYYNLNSDKNIENIKKCNY